MTVAVHAAARTATGLTLAGLLVPAAGFAVEVALAWRFGTAGLVDAYRVCGVFLLLGQHLLLVHLMPQLVVALLARARAAGGEAEGWRLAMTVANVLTAACAAAAAAVFLWPEPVLALLAPGLGGEGRAAAVTLVRWFALVFPLLAWSGVAAGILQARSVFWVAPAAQLTTHLLVAGFVVIAGAALGAGALALAVLMGAAATAALYAVRLTRLEERPGPVAPWRAGFSHPGLGGALRMGLPLLALFAVAQLAPLVVNRVLSGETPGTLAAFGYAFKLGLLATLAPAALATALYPRLAERGFAADPAEFAALGRRSLAMAVFLSVPVAAALVALREPVVALVLERGAFGAADTRAVARLFGWLVAAAPAAVVMVFLEKMHFALGRMWAPTAARAAVVAVLAILGPVAGKAGGAEGIAALLSLLSVLAAAALALALARTSPALGLAALARGGATVLLLALVAAWISRQAAAAVGAGLPEGSAVALLTSVVVGAGAATAAYAAGAYALGVPEAVACGRYLRWQGFEAWKQMAGERGRREGSNEPAR